MATKRTFAICVSSFCLTICFGCYPPDTPETQPRATVKVGVDQGVLAGVNEPSAESTDETPWRDATENAISQNNWKLAQSLVQRALLEFPNDPVALQLAADVAFANEQVDEAVDFIVEATIADRFQDDALIKRARNGLLSVGKLYETIDLLEQVIERFPDKLEFRRDLFDYLINVEEHSRAIPHGRILVRQRNFDRVLLFALCTTEQRSMEGESMKTLSQRNPSDRRLQLAEIRIAFDRGRWEGIEEKLLNVLKYSPTNVAAQCLLGRYYVESGQMDRLGEWTSHLTPEVETTWQYWFVLGEWANAERKHSQAARAYWEAVRRNVDIGEAFAKLAKTLLVLKSEGDDVDESLIEAAHDRAELLSRFTQDKERFYRFGNHSNAIIVDVAKSLMALGRLWEAEAWTAYAMTIPDENIADATTMRQIILKELSSQTPWQETDGHPALAMDLSEFSLPSLEQLKQASIATNIVSFQPSIKPILQNESLARGLTIAAPRTRSGKKIIPLYAQLESGGCTIDYDLDGWPDVYFASAGGDPGKNNSRPNYLYRNLGGYFTDVTTTSATTDSGYGQGVNFGDVNEDGFHDFIVMNYGVNRLFINNGDGTFSDASSWLPNDGQPHWSTSGAIADINGDGISDLVTLRYCDAVDPVNTPCGDLAAGNEIACVPTKFAAERDRFMAGSAEGGFDDVTDKWSATPVHTGRGLGVIVGSLDPNAGIDVLIANDMTDNHFWSPVYDRETDQEFSIVESATLRGLALDGRFRPQASMGIAAADLDDDLDVDFFITNFEQEHNSLYEQTSSGIWSDRTVAFGLIDASFDLLGFGTQAVDFDNDSHLEIAITNGHVDNAPNAPATYSQKMQIIRRKSKSHFQVIEFDRSSGYVSDDHVGRALWTIDADRDGRTDLMITHQTEPPALLMNQTSSDAHWINIRLVGVDAARDAIGSKVTIQFADQERMMPLVSGDGFFCGNERVLHFGLGNTIEPGQEMQVDVSWPDGTQRQYTAVPDREYLIIQNDDAFELLR